MATDNSVVITKETIKRLTKDIREMIKNPLDQDGIYYKHDEANMLQGYAYINGPNDSQYIGGNYFFKFNFPYDYPHQPPKVEFVTNDGITRFHPNLYKNGKVCLSILNTWRGEQWSGCQSIRTILLTIISIMDKYPLLHEPGFSMSHSDVNRYNEIILFKNLEFSVINIINKLNDKSSPISFSYYIDLFKNEIISEFKKNKNNILSILEKKKDLSNETITTNVYKLNVLIDWKYIYNQFNEIKI